MKDNQSGILDKLSPYDIYTLQQSNIFESIN